jgi:pimeloyl-ACP methyl ester carboxylesterase
LPYLSGPLATLREGASLEKQKRPLYSCVALSYRGYWNSSGRPSHSGILLDVAAVLRYIRKRHTQRQVILWGQSIGSAAALAAAVRLLSHPSPDDPKLKGVILETPILSIAELIRTFYPQRWLPYRYLTPFSVNRWDNAAALHELTELGGTSIPLLMLLGAKDEVVPAEQTEELYDLSLKLGFKTKRVILGNALHSQVMVRPETRREVVNFVRSNTERVSVQGPPKLFEATPAQLVPVKSLSREK